jgi:glycosyltransferase involved in cell wall biosynthesis
MRVLITTSTFPLRVDDGLPRFVYDLAESLAQQCDVTALAPDAPGALLQERMGSVKVRRFTYFFPRRWQSLAYGHGMRENLRAKWMSKLQILPFVWKQARATRALVREVGINVVNSHWIIPQGLSTALVHGSSCRFAHLLTVHAADVYMLRRLPFGTALARYVMKHTDVVFADGSHVRDSLDDLLGFESKAVLQPNGVETAVFRRRDDIQPVDSPFPDGFLLFFGRFAEKKGVTYLLKALPKILDHHPGIGLILIGYGMLERDLRREVSSLQIDQSVKFVGKKSHAEIVRYLHECRIAVVPSIIDQYGETEGMPTVVLEAMAASVRVVASAVDGIPDVIRHGENGWLCREKDPEDLAEKILLALQDQPSSKVLARAQETAARFDWSEVAASYLETFERILDTTSFKSGKNLTGL